MLYVGVDCELEVSICTAGNPCGNNGICEPVGSSYRCLCPIGFQGQNCQEGKEVAVFEYKKLLSYKQHSTSKFNLIFKTYCDVT